MRSIKSLLGIKKPIDQWKQDASDIIKSPIPTASWSEVGIEYEVVPYKWDGEKTQGELGAPKYYIPKYVNLANRSWQAYTESDLAQIVVNARVDWVIGPGLNLQAEPNKHVITKSEPNFKFEEFKKEVENRFRLYSETKTCAYSNMHNFYKLQRLAEKAATIGGDVLIVFRMGESGPNIQLIDGRQVRTPLDIAWKEKAEKKGNKIIHGVEIDKNTGEHIAFYVNAPNNKSTRLLARGPKTKRLQAVLKYGSEYRVDDVRGLPLLSAMLEKITKIDRYVEATVGSAEERAKVVWFTKHGAASDGQDPLLSQIAQAASGGQGLPEDKITSQYEDLKKTGNQIARTTGKTVYNMPIDSTLDVLDSKVELNMPLFVDTNFVYIAAAARVPYEVALMKYVNSFSSSRMATQSYSNLLKIERSVTTSYFQKPYYALFLEHQILNNKISAPGYSKSIMDKDVIMLQAYKHCRFIGPGVPQANPLQEVNTSIAKIDNKLSSREQEVEQLGDGDWKNNIERLGEEQDIINETFPDTEPDDTENNK